MTKDEAIAAFNAAGGNSFSAEAFIDRFVALGILNLESVEEQAEGSICFLEVPFKSYKQAEMRCTLGSEAAREIIRTLTAAGFKITKA